MAEKFKGGQGDGVKDDEVDLQQLKKGASEENKEHGFDEEESKETAKDHLVNDPLYYDHLERMEKAVDKKQESLVRFFSLT
jgi:hypothetical protein